MSVNLVNLIKGQLGDSALEQLGGLLGESAENTKNAVNASVPTIIGSIADKVANDSNAAGMLSNALDDLDPGMAVDFNGLLGSDNHTSIVEKGAGLLQGLFGDKLSGVTDLLSQFSGMGSKSSSSLLSMVLPMVLGALNKQKRINGLDNAGVLNLLSNQNDYVSQAMPSGMGDLLNSSGLIGGLSTMLGSAKDAVTDAASDAVAGVADTAADVAGSAADAASSAAGAVTDAVGDAASSAADAASNVAGSAADAVGDAASSAANAASNVADSAVESAKDAASGVADTASQAASSGGSMIKKILPIAAVVLLVLFILKSCM